MGSESRRTAVKLGIVAAFSCVLFVAAAPLAYADNVVGSPSDITFNAGTSNSALKVKIVSNTAQSNAGDPVSGCNVGVKDDGLEVTVDLLISPALGLSASPNPIKFDECNKFKTVTLTGNIGGTYTITASAEDNDLARDGVYHLEPFGTVTVVVVDTTPPETTIGSTPANPTAKLSADFTFSSSETGSTFECSLDNSAFAACPGPAGAASYAGLPVGTHTFQVRAIDASGNVDPTPALFTWEIKALAITIDPITPGSWGNQINVGGTADVVDLTGPVVDVDWGDLSPPTTGIAISGNSWASQHIYSAGGTYTVTARLMEGAVERASATSQVVIDRHETALEIISPMRTPEGGDPQVTTNTKITFGGNLTDLDAGEAVVDRAIQFTGFSSPDATTQGVTFTGDVTIVTCAVPAACIEDGIGIDDDGTDNRVLHIGVGGKISFPTTTTTALVYIQDITDDFEFRVIEHTGDQQDCSDDPGMQDCTLGVPAAGEAGKISATSGFTTDGNGVTIFNGIKEIIITKVGGTTTDGTVGIAAILTKNDDSAPSEQHQINFEDEPAGPRSSPFTVNGGLFFTYFVTPNAEASNEVAEADFAGDNLYKPSHGSITYDVQLDQDGLGGVGGSDGGSGAGTTQTGRSCTGSCDLEKDAIPDAEETQGFVDDAIAPGLKWFFPETHDKTKVDIDYEIDCMAGVMCLTQAQADYIERRFALRGITMHIDIDETGICGPSAVNPVHVWDDADANECNDFKSIKLNNYGTPAEKANGDLGSGNGLLKLKHLVSRYMLITYNTNSGTNQACGTTGVGELIGNDAVVSVECLLVTANPAGKPQILLGTVMHEMGHNLGLKHGGTDDINCKCNYLGVMNYQGQMPTTDRPVPGVNQATNVGWYGDYSHGPLLYQTSGGANIGDGKKITEGATLADGNKLVLSGSTWKAADGVDITSEVTVTQFKLLWSDTTPNAVQPIKSALTGAAINWNGIAGLTAIQDINYLTVKVGSKQLPACTQSSELTDLVSPVDDYATIKANVAKAMDQATDLLGISEHGLQDPDLIPEMNLHIFEELNSVSFHSPGVEPPLNNVGFGDPALSKIKKGSTVNVKFNLFDDQGNEVTGSNALSQYLIDRIDLRIALVTTAGTPPEEADYFSPPTSTQPGSLDRFSFDGSKWSLSYGTKNLVLNGDYTARIILRFTTGEMFVLDNKNDGVDNISFNFKIVKG